MGFWWLDRVLPGMVAGIPVFLTGLWVQFRFLRQHVDRTTADQNKVFQRKLDAQTKKLTDSSR